MRDPRPLLAILLLFYLLFGPDTQLNNVPLQRFNTTDVLVQERLDLQIANGSRFGDFAPLHDKWLGLSGFTNDTGFAWSYLESYQRKVEALQTHALGDSVRDKLVGEPVGDPLPLYKNISGVLHGQWHLDEVAFTDSPPTVNISAFAPVNGFGIVPITGFARNLTTAAGTITVRLSADKGSVATEQRESSSGEMIEAAAFVTALIAIDAFDDYGNRLEFKTHGVHYLESGSMLLSTTSSKFLGAYGLPQLANTPSYFRLAQGLMTRVVNQSITAQAQGRIGYSSAFTANNDGSVDGPYSIPNCELVVFFQQYPVSLPGVPEKDRMPILRVIEDELRFPTGAPAPQAAPMHFAMTAFSPDCGFAIDSTGPPAFPIQQGNHLVGIKSQMEQKQARHHIMLFGFVLMAQLWTLKRQMKESSTPLTRSRISFYTVVMMALSDGFVTISFLMASVFLPGMLGLLLAACAFLAFVGSSFFGMQFLVDIWSVQAPAQERRERERRAASAANNPSDVTATPVAPAAPARVIATGTVPIIIGADQEPVGEDTLPMARNLTAQPPPIRNTFEASLAPCYLLLLVTIFFSYWATSWSSGARRIYFTCLAFACLSFWVPQIYRNVIRNCRHALRWDFVICQSLLRLAPFAYAFAYEHNMLFAEIHYLNLAVLVLWLWVQCLVLVSQEALGARWFVKSSWVPVAYDYHMVMREDEEGGNLPVGASEMSPAAGSSTDTAAKEADAHDPSKRVFDCAICMLDIEVHVQTGSEPLERGLAGPGGLLARRAYMLTPCRHIFHSTCLEGWMKYRLQCPICREDLPPI